MVVAASVTSPPGPDSARLTGEIGDGHRLVLLPLGRGGIGTLLIAQAAKLRDQRGQALPLDELHRVIVNASLAADGMHRHDLLVLHVRSRKRLGLEPLEPARVDGRGERQDLERNPPPQRDLLGLVDDSHPAPAHLAQEPEVAELTDARQGDRPALRVADRPAHEHRFARRHAAPR